MNHEPPRGYYARAVIAARDFRDETVHGAAAIDDDGGRLRNVGWGHGTPPTWATSLPAARARRT